MNKEKSKWNARYKTRSSTTLSPEAFLAKKISCFRSGTILDLGSGDGRNALFLGEKGFKVTAVDFSEVALKRLIDLANERGLEIETKLMDLEKSGDFDKLPEFDNIVAVRYKLSDDLIKFIPSLLNKGGLFLYYTFNWKQAENSSFPDRFCLKEEELVSMDWDLELIEHTSFEDSRGYHDGYLFRK